MNLQSTFNDICRHFFTQAVPYISKHGACRYREELPDGKILKCSIGVLISDTDYARDVEGKGIRQLGLFKNLSLQEQEFLIYMQWAHDNAARAVYCGSGGAYMTHLCLGLAAVAKKFSLNDDILTEAPRP